MWSVGSFLQFNVALAVAAALFFQTVYMKMCKKKKKRGTPVAKEINNPHVSLQHECDGILWSEQIAKMGRQMQNRSSWTHF